MISSSISPALGSSHVWGLLKLLSMAERRQGNCCFLLLSAATARTVKGCIESTTTPSSHTQLKGATPALNSGLDLRFFKLWRWFYTCIQGPAHGKQNDLFRWEGPLIKGCRMGGLDRIPDRHYDQQKKGLKSGKGFF